eukprot:CAMPEP_0172926090 /NCGR_PEP_ID=MMETSP1075-20121228/214948_1 /TAXON_ID=2916 /ORGANISM="Ceratium fusus, Strain PA161109" /LENGTH=41 /DNA_ID= /DNA_START= /DNA_END= /DNA_ORIENTATION=
MQIKCWKEEGVALEGADVFLAMEVYNTDAGPRSLWIRGNML